MDNARLDKLSTSAPQQPEWGDEALAQEMRDELGTKAPLVHANAVQDLRTVLAEVAVGEAHVIQAGDCAEDPDDSDAGSTARKAGLLDVLAGTMKMATGKPIVRVGRIAGQYGKPRSKPTEMVGDRELPVYRGHLVNSPAPDADSREADPRRLLSCYYSASDVVGHLGWQSAERPTLVESPVWTSHEALVLDFEMPMLRDDDTGGRLLTSTHWPWIGERTRQSDGAHVEMLSDVDNPVACKVGPLMEVDELLDLCRRLDPDRRPGRLTLIARMGAGVGPERLPGLVAAVLAAGHPVIWLCDPMHGNTIATQDGLKTRCVHTVVQEVQEFQMAVLSAGGIAGGLHLETTPENVTECVDIGCDLDRVGELYTSLCDPRLNPAQAVVVVSSWTGDES